MLPIPISFLLLIHGARSAAPVPVRPDWTDVPQGERILPRLTDTGFVNPLARKYRQPFSNYFTVLSMELFEKSLCMVRISHWEVAR
jgi:hypothetical protein